MADVATIWQQKSRQLPKAELHLHLEGSISPSTVSLLGERRGVAISPESAAARYEYSDFAGFLDAFKWATGYLKTPEDYSLIAHRLADELVRQNVIYAEVTLSVGVMLRYSQNVEANFNALAEVADRYRENGLRIMWIFDATRQFGADAAMKVAVLAAKFQKRGVLAFGIGGDELSVPTGNFRAVYEFARSQGLHLLIHAGEIGGPEIVRESVDLLGVERIGHGIAAMRDPALAERLATLRIPLEICPTSNLRTGALATPDRQTESRIVRPSPARFCGERHHRGAFDGRSRDVRHGSNDRILECRVARAFGVANCAARRGKFFELLPAARRETAVARAIPRRR